MNEVIGPRLEGMTAADQIAVDFAMLELDGTPNKGHLGANAILAVSLAVARAAAEDAGLPLYRYLGGPLSHVLPVPMMNILNGGAHATNNVDFQEFMVVPIGAETFPEGAAHGRRGVPRAEEGADQARARRPPWATKAASRRTCRTTKRRSKRSSTAIESAGFEAGKEVAIALDPAASELYEDGTLRLQEERRRHARPRTR